MNEAIAAAALTALTAAIVQLAALKIDTNRKRADDLEESLVDVKAERDKLRGEVEAWRTRWQEEHDALILERAKDAPTRAKKGD